VPEFAAAVHAGRADADAQVARGLYTRAVGYNRAVERTQSCPQRGEDGQDHGALSARYAGLHLLAAQPPAPQGCGSAARGAAADRGPARIRGRREHRSLDTGGQLPQEIDVTQAY
jgi:hypothetical protein